MLYNTVDKGHPFAQDIQSMSAYQYYFLLLTESEIHRIQNLSPEERKREEIKKRAREEDYM